MGNCMLKWFGVERKDMVKVVTSDGGIMELLTPITAECISGEFPGHAIFRSRSIFAEPLLHREELLAGEVYYLLPLNPYNPNHKKLDDGVKEKGVVVTTPYRMSREAEVVPRYSGKGVWKVKLVISPQHLSQILSHDNRTEELIDNVRTVAKCGNGGASLPNSEHSSVAGHGTG